MAGIESTGGVQYPNVTADGWDKLAKVADGESWATTWQDLGGVDLAVNDSANELRRSEDNVPVEMSEEPQPERTPEEERESRLVGINQERMKESEAELEKFQEKLEMSPEAYWQELRKEYTQNGVNLGLMPDLKEMRGYAQEYLAQNVGGGDQKERVNIALKTELEKMAQAKSAEIKHWQSDGRGLPVTFEREWLESGRNDLRNLLSGYYGDEGKLNREARKGGELTDDEKVAWQMAALPHKPGTLNPTWVFRSDAGRFDDETTLEYYNRLKNYRAQDQMRDWQIKQDQQKDDRREEQRRQRIEMEDTERAREQWENDPEGVQQAIAETDAEIAGQYQEQEKTERAELEEKVKKKPSFVAAVKKMFGQVLRRLTNRGEVEGDDGIVDEAAVEGGVESEVGAEAEVENEIESEAEAEKTEEEVKVGAEVEVKAEKKSWIDLETLTPEKVEQLLALKRRAEIALAADNLAADSRERQSIAENYEKISKVLSEYEAKQELESRSGEFNFVWLQGKGLISGETGKKGLEELKVLREATNQALLEAVWDEQEIAADEYRQRLVAIKHAMEWVQQGGMRNMEELGGAA